MNCFEITTFKAVVDDLKTAYPRRNIELIGNLVHVDGEAKFNISGFNLLYNLQRLVNCLEDELI